MDSTAKQIYWQKHLANCASSGMSQKAYCAQEALKPSTFSYWRRQLRSVEASSSKLIPVTMPALSTVRLTVCGVPMELPVDALEQVLPILWRSLRAMR